MKLRNLTAHWPKRLKHRVVLASAIGCLAFSAFAQWQPSGTHPIPNGQAQPTLAITQYSIGLHVIQAEVADDAQTRQIGLMFRTKLTSNHGMLFIFDVKNTQCMWMRNTLIPLSVAFIDENGDIVNIEDMSPQSDQRHCSSQPVRHALEMPQGWFAQRGIKPGAHLKRLSD